MRNRHKYPVDWKSISLAVRTAANWTCQQCGKKCRKPGESIEDFLSRSGNLPTAEVQAHPTRYCLTVAHLNHTPADCCIENLKAMCAPCHLRYDSAHHVQSRLQNRKARQEDQGQLTLF